jgi:phosphate transport system substrate-binding protein
MPGGKYFRRRSEGHFSGEITNWKEIGGADLPVLVIIPDENTAANKNFRRQIMKDKEIKHDFITYDSTMVLEAIKHFPCGAISFISRGATIKYEEIAAIKIDGVSPSDKDYPYFQTFYYVTKGAPSETAKKLIDFTTTGKGTRDYYEKRHATIESIKKVILRLTQRSCLYKTARWVFLLPHNKP